MGIQPGGDAGFISRRSTRSDFLDSEHGPMRSRSGGLVIECLRQPEFVLMIARQVRAFCQKIMNLVSEKFCNWIIMRRSVNLRSE